MRHRGIVAGCLALVASLGACSLQPEAPVTLYGANARPAAAWFAITPLADPPQSVGFVQDGGVACLIGPVGSEIVWFDGTPGQGGVPIKAIARVGADVDAKSNVLWVTVAADGELEVGQGVPEWWVGDVPVCRVRD